MSWNVMKMSVSDFLASILEYKVIGYGIEARNQEMSLVLSDGKREVEVTFSYEDLEITEDSKREVILED